MKQNEKLLLVDDDLAFSQVMTRALTRRGFEVEACQSIDKAEAALHQHCFQRAIIDLKIAHESGLTLIKKLKSISPSIEIVVITGYSSVSTAVEAIKLGAVNYFCKPVEIDEVLMAFSPDMKSDELILPELPPSLGRLEWEHIQKTLQDNQGNISETARMLGMHRRTLQRKLQKRPVNF